MTKVREGRKERDEPTAVKGSTRLEAKKQRRREGREAGRRRTVITEAEFLARRESVDRKMVIRQSEEYSQLAVLEDGVLVEHYVDRASATSAIGNVYLGKVVRVQVTGADVIHKFTVPSFGIKQDAIPGIVNEAWTDIIIWAVITGVVGTVIKVGIINAVPAAWKTRPTSKMPKAGASAAKTVPARNTPAEARKIWRVVNLSMRKPVVGMTTPMVSRKPVSNHWAEVAGMSKSAMMAGNATERAVSFRIITIAPRTRMVRLIFTSAEMCGSGF